jgi:phosphoglycerate dehydrogenase-like enzyme
MKLVIADRQWSAYAGEFASRLGPTWHVVSCPGGPETLRSELAGADALLALDIPCEVLPSAAGLKLFLYPGAGVLRSEAGAYPAGCAVVNVGEHGVAIAEYVMAAILMHVTRIAEYSASFRQGCWTGSGRTGGTAHQEAFEKTIGLIGFGCIGRAVAARALAFGMRVLAIRSRRLPDSGTALDLLGGPSDLPVLLRESDYLVIACPLNSRTRGMLGARELASMKPSAYLINVSRASIVEETALYEALRQRRLVGAALDVWYRYPENGEEVFHGSSLPFHELPNVLATPHMAGWTQPVVQRRISRMIETLKQYESGKPLDRVVLIGASTPGGEGAHC